MSSDAQPDLLTAYEKVKEHRRFLYPSGGFFRSSPIMREQGIEGMRQMLPDVDLLEMYANACEDPTIIGPERREYIGTMVRQIRSRLSAFEADFDAELRQVELEETPDDGGLDYLLRPHFPLGRVLGVSK